MFSEKQNARNNLNRFAAVNHSVPWLHMPTLTETPTKKSVSNGIFISVLASLFAVILYFITAESYPGVFFGVLVSGMLAHAVLAYYWFRGNILIFFRYFLLFLPVFITVLAWWVWSGDVLTAPFGSEYQTLGSTSILVTGGFLALMGCTSGWLTAFQGYKLSGGGLFASVDREKTLLSQVGMFLTVTFAVLYVIQCGGTISDEHGYASNEVRGLGFEFGVFNIFQHMGISLLLLLAAGFPASRLKLYLIIGIGLFLGIMAGSRADYLPTLLITSFYFWVLHERAKQNKTKRPKRRVFEAKRLVLFMLLGIFGFIAASGLALWRASPSLSVVEVAESLIDRGSELLVNDLNGHRMIYIETGNMAIGGMYGLIENTRRDGFLWGSTYVDYLMRSPPAFLGLERPEDLAFRTGVGNVMMSQGGTFEPAEAYVNFGLPGCFVVSFILSYFMAFLLKAASRRGSIFYACWYLVFGLMGLREVWYQTFAYFRLATIFLLLFIVLRQFKPSFLGINPLLVMPKKRTLV